MCTAAAGQQPLASSAHDNDSLELEPRRLKKAHEWLDVISSQWDDAIDRLRAYVED